MATDTERIDWLEQHAREGGCPALLNDDNGHWAVSGDGTQNLPSGDQPEDIWTSFVVEAGKWYPSIREAIDAFIAEDEAEDIEASS